MVARLHDLAHALAAEFAAIHGAEPPIDRPRDLSRMHSSDRTIRVMPVWRWHPERLLFALGVIQALARAGLLRQFDYLSTVSGGGFIGSWLSMLIAQKGGVAARAGIARQRAAPAVAALRDYTDYLTPHAGMLSDDTWAGIVLYLRNVLINWFALPSGVCARGAGGNLLSHPAVDRQCEQCSGGVGTGYRCRRAVLSNWRVCRDLPSHRPIAAGGHGVHYLPPRSVWNWITCRCWSGLSCVPLALAQMAQRGTRWRRLHPSVWLPLIYVAAMLIGYWCAAIPTVRSVLYFRNLGRGLSPPSLPRCSHHRSGSIRASTSRS